MLRHGAPSATLPSPFEIGGLDHCVPDSTGTCKLIHPFGLDFEADAAGARVGFVTGTAGGGGATSSCTVAITVEWTRCVAGL